MLVSFNVTNYKTFRDRAEWSMIAATDTTREEENVVAAPFRLRLLKSAVVYGANASGKSKLVDALAFVKRFVRISANDSQAGDPIAVEPFRLNPRTATEPSEFELVFLHAGALYRYGFAATTKEVTAEWLYIRAKTKEVMLFHRQGTAVQLHSKDFSGMMGQLIKEKRYRSNALLLSYLGQFDHPAALAVLAWLRDELSISSGLITTREHEYTEELIARDETKQDVLRLLQAADLQITDLKMEVVRDEPPSHLPETIREDIRQHLRSNPSVMAVLGEPQTFHALYDDENHRVGSANFSLSVEESAGTQKFFALIGPILSALENGQVWVVDELDARLHPNLVTEIVRLFNSAEHNPHGAQLLFNTHDTNLLAGDHFRRDQIWFTERDRYGAASLYALNDIKTPEGRKPRDTEKFERNYIQGRYGAIPFLGGFANLPISQPTPADE